MRHCFRPSNQLRQVALELSQGAQPDTVAAAFARELRHHGRSGYPYRHLLGFTLLYALGLVSLLLLQRRRLSTIWGLSGLALGVVGFTLVALVWRRALPSVGPLQITLCVKDLSADWMVDRRLSGVYHWQDTRQFALAFDGRGVRVDPVRCVWRRFEQYQEREVARAVGVDPAQPLKPLILAVHRPGVGSTGWQASFREVDGGVYLTMVNPLEERLRDVVLVTPGGVYLLPDLSRGRNELRLDDGKPLSAWLESGPRLQNKIVCRALLRESFSAPSRRGGVPNIWSLSSVLDRGQGVLFARASTLSPLLSFPDLQGLRRENIVFVRGVVLRDAQ